MPPSRLDRIFRSALRRFLALACLVCLPWLSVAASIPDVSVQTHTGAQTQLVSGLMADKVVALHFMYPACRSLCRVLGKVMAETQNRLIQDAVAEHARFISISITPQQSAPSKLAAWLKRHDARDGWTAVRIEPRELSEVMLYFGETPAEVMLHSSQVLVIDRQGNIVHRFNDTPTPKQLAQSMRQALAQ